MKDDRIPRFDPETGAPIRMDAPEYGQPRFDPETGAPIQRRGVHPQYETEPDEYEQPRFDPETGAPIQRRGVHPQYETEPVEYGQPRFDPETGAPLYRDEKVHTGRRGDRNGIDLSDSFEQPEKPEKKNIEIRLMSER